MIHDIIGSGILVLAGAGLGGAIGYFVCAVMTAGKVADEVFEITLKLWDVGDELSRLSFKFLEREDRLITINRIATNLFATASDGSPLRKDVDRIVELSGE